MGAVEPLAGRIATSSYSAFRPEFGHAIRITRFPPRWRLPYVLAGSVMALAPSWLTWQLRDDSPAFTASYLAQLDELDVDTITQLIAAVVPSGKAILLCFEKDPAHCHRSLFRSWWLSKTGYEVPELRSPSTPTKELGRSTELLLPC